MHTHKVDRLGVSMLPTGIAKHTAQHGELGKKCDLLHFIYEEYCIFADREFIVHREVKLLMQWSNTLTYKQMIWSNFMRATSKRWLALPHY